MFKACWIALLVISLSAAAAGARAAPHLFDDAAPLKVTITAPLRELVRGAKTSTRPYPATVTVADDAGVVRDVAIQLSARGVTRRTGGYCAFPPLMLKFAKEAPQGTLFRGQRRLKLVTYCDTPSAYEQRVILEYLAYRLYNLITPMSFRVRAAEITYRERAEETGMTRFGFFIEELDDVASRNDLEPMRAETREVRRTQLEPVAAARAALFEYMIGNLDWDFLAGHAGEACCHNSKFIAASGASPATATAVVPVPYDWDYSGFVDAPYALPPEGLHVARVTQRLYRGYCVSTPELPGVIEEFRAHKADLLAVIEGEPLLTQAFRAKAVRFLQEFYAVLDDPARVDREIIKHCR